MHNFMEDKVQSSMQKYSQSQLYFKILCANKDVSVMTNVLCLVYKIKIYFRLQREAGFLVLCLGSVYS